MTLDKYITALAWVVCPCATLLIIGVFTTDRDKFDYSTAQLFFWAFGFAVLSGAWLLARYAL